MDFNKIYCSQIRFQRNVEKLSFKHNLPIDNPFKFQYHMTAMTEELGEVLKADKRWKTHRNVRLDKSEKLDEIADVFITAMNISMWSGFSSTEIYEAIENKIAINQIRIEGEI